MVSHPPLGPAMERPAHSATKSVGSSWSVRSGSDRDKGSTAVACWRQGLRTTTLGRAAKCRPSAGPCKRQALSPFSASSNIPTRHWALRQPPNRDCAAVILNPHYRSAPQHGLTVQKLVRNFQIDRRWYEAVRVARCDFLSLCRIHAERGWHCLPACWRCDVLGGTHGLAPPLARAACTNRSAQSLR